METIFSLVPCSQGAKVSPISVPSTLRPGSIRAKQGTVLLSTQCFQVSMPLTVALRGCMATAKAEPMTPHKEPLQEVEGFFSCSSLTLHQTVCACVGMCVGHEDNLACVSPSVKPSAFFVTGLLVGLELFNYARLAGWRIPGIFLALPPQYKDHVQAPHGSPFTSTRVLGSKPTSSCLQDKSFSNRVIFLN